MKKILVPTDFSLPARWAFEAAMGIARKSGAALVLLHVIEQPVPQSYNVGGEADNTEWTQEDFYTIRLIESQRSQLLQWAADFESDDVMVTTVLRIGNAFHGIAKIISEEAVDLVVMGTTGHSLLERLFLGSNTDKVIRLSKAPVLTIHGRPSTDVFKNIVYASSLEDCEASFVNIVKFAQALYGATLHMVRINTPESFIPDPEILLRFEKFIHDMKFENYTINIFNDRNAEDGIVRFAESIHADLICIAVHGRSLLIDVLTGNTAEEVAGHSRRPVLTYVTR